MLAFYDRASDVLLAEVNLTASSELGKRNEFQIVKGYRKMWAAWHKTTTFILKQENESSVVRIVGFPASRQDTGRFTYLTQDASVDLLP